MSELDEPTEHMPKVTTNQPEQLRECINSGQVSAAQVVAHAEAGELPEPAFHLKYRDGKYRVSKPEIDDVNCYTAEQMRAYATAVLAAERAEAVRLREALIQGEALINGDLTGLEWKVECRKFLVAARAALGLYQGEANEHKR